jgi:hypothetical protein
MGCLQERGWWIELGRVAWEYAPAGGRAPGTRLSKVTPERGAPEACPWRSTPGGCPWEAPPAESPLKKEERCGWGDGGWGALERGANGGIPWGIG